IVLEQWTSCSSYLRGNAFRLRGFRAFCVDRRIRIRSRGGSRLRDHREWKNRVPKKTETTFTTINAEPAEHTEGSHQGTKPTRARLGTVDFVFFVSSWQRFRLRGFRAFCVDRRRIPALPPFLRFLGQPVLLTAAPTAAAAS